MVFADIRTELLSPELLFPLGLTLRVCLLCLILHALTAIPLAWWAQRPGAPFRRVVSFLVTLPLVFPPIGMRSLSIQLCKYQLTYPSAYLQFNGAATCIV